MNIHIYHHIGDDKEEKDFRKKVLELLFVNNQNQTTIMALIDDLKTQVSDLKQGQTDLQATVDAEQAQIAALLETNAQVVSDLNAQIAVLQAQVANGASPEQLTEVITSLTEMKDSLATTKADIEGTVS